MKKIILLLIGLNLTLIAGFEKVGDVITDDISQLQWQDNSDAKAIKKNWFDALTYCEALSLGEEDDWRLPNIKELLSIADKNKNTPPAINSTFTNVAYTPENLSLYTVLYWSSTTPLETNYTDTAMTVNFNYGDEYYYDFFGNVALKETNMNHVRCVRGGL